MCLSVQLLTISLVTDMASGNCPQAFFSALRKRINSVPSSSLWLPYFLANIFNTDLSFDCANEPSFSVSSSSAKRQSCQCRWGQTNLHCVMSCWVLCGHQCHPAVQKELQPGGSVGWCLLLCSQVAFSSSYPDKAVGEIWLGSALLPLARAGCSFWLTCILQLLRVAWGNSCVSWCDLCHPEEDRVVAPHLLPSTSPDLLSRSPAGNWSYAGLCFAGEGGMRVSWTSPSATMF